MRALYPKALRLRSPGSRVAQGGARSAQTKGPRRHAGSDDRHHAKMRRRLLRAARLPQRSPGRGGAPVPGAHGALPFARPEIDVAVRAYTDFPAWVDA